MLVGRIIPVVRLVVLASLLPTAALPTPHSFGYADAIAAHAPSSPVVRGANWAGYVSTADLATDYLGVRATLIQPRAAKACWPEAEALTWVGLGGFKRRGNAMALIQVGTAADVDIMSGITYRAWYQFLRTDLAGNQIDGSEQVVLPIAIRPYDRIRLATSVAPGTGLATFEVANDTTHQRVLRRVAVPAGFHDPRTAELITERTLGVGLARFDTVAWSQAQVQYADRGWRPLSRQPLLTKVVMSAGTTPLAASAPSLTRSDLAAPGDLAADSTFATRWRACR